MKLHSDSFPHRGPIPAEFAFGRIGDAENPIALSANRNPHLAWEDVPDGTASFVLLCVDPDAPSRAEDVNRRDRIVPADLPRVEFVHWVLVDIPASIREIAAGALSDGIVARGKPAGHVLGGARQGRNDYTHWFANDPDMAGTYHGYDGPCPPFNDAIAHRYFFRVFALSVAQLTLPDGFDAARVLAAMQGKVLAEALHYGSYGLNLSVL
ncbi:MAG: YbhB/YbcL family Raf kinase inhibitor-like protein [Xanthomonadales bacterium]|nr:YbhB/YbcL family Raf kinase inhibitor-like protein [Xanthomonadales bacterium]